MSVFRTAPGPRPHTCPIVGCPYRLPWRLLMCPAHFKLVPPELRRRLWDAWNNGSPRSYAAYLEAREAAIRSVDPARGGGARS